MRRIITIRSLLRKNLKIFYFSVLFFSGNTYANSQFLSVHVIQGLNFGTFLQGNNGGTITIHPDGMRSTTGDVTPLDLNSTYFQAIFEMEAPVGTIVSILSEPDAVLTGSNGGSITLHIDGSYPASPFIITTTYPERTQVNIGGTLSISGSLTTKPGVYSGTFAIIFNQE